jgi:hypothetical protein
LYRSLRRRPLLNPSNSCTLANNLAVFENLLKIGGAAGTD